MRFFSFLKRVLRLRTGNDKWLRCMECNKEFLFEGGEQEFFRQKGFQEPKRCPECRKEHRPGGNRFRRR